MRNILLPPNKESEDDSSESMCGERAIAAEKKDAADLARFRRRRERKRGKLTRNYGCIGIVKLEINCNEW